MKFGISLFLLLTICACQAQETTQIKTTDKADTMKYNALTQQEERVLVYKATDRPYTGDYYNKKDAGIYICRRCNNPLYRSEDKFDSHCGWPSFDDEIEGAVKRVADADGYRTEIICMNCGGHLGHVFLGEGFTEKETRHCVNTSSLRFVPQSELSTLPEVIR
jgi:methionine-R-sulfoxide reductase